MKNRITYALAGVLQLLALIMIVCNVLDVEAFSFLTTGLFSMAAAIPAGVVTEQSYHDNPDDLLKRSVDDLVVLFKPDRFPLTTMKQNMKSAVQAKARKEEWINVGYHARSTTADGATAAGTGGADVAVKVSDIDMWGPGDVLSTPTLTAGTPAVVFKGYVTKLDTTDSTVTVRPINVTNVPAFAGGELVVKQSRAAAASDAQTTPHGAQGVDAYNYCQTFMGQFTIEKILDSIGTYVDDRTVQQDLEMFDFRNSLEMADLFGPRAKTYDPEKKKYIYTQGGFDTYATKVANYTSGSGITTNDWVDIAKKSFAGNAGSEEKLLIGGKDFIGDVLKNGEVQKQIGPEAVEMVLGVKVQRISVTFGDFLIKWHKGFDEAGRSGDAYSLDLNYLYDSVLEPMQEKELDLDTSGQARVHATRILTTKTVKVRYPDTHMIITPS